MYPKTNFHLFLTLPSVLALKAIYYAVNERQGYLLEYEETLDLALSRGFIWSSTEEGAFVWGQGRALKKISPYWEKKVAEQLKEVGPMLPQKVRYVMQKLRSQKLISLQLTPLQILPR